MDISEKTLKNIGEVMLVSVDDIMPNPNQPRKSFTEQELSALTRSIESVGIIQPLTVRKNGNKFELIAGERRLRAAKNAGLKFVPCVHLSTNNSGSAVISLIENIQRQSLNFFEEAQGIDRLLKEFNITRDEACAYLGLAQSTLSNKLRLLAIPNDVCGYMIENKLTERHARALLKLPTGEEMRRFAALITEKQLSVAASEALINEYLSGKSSERHKKPVLKDIKIFINTISNAVTVMRKAGIMADSTKRETEDYIEYRVMIPKKRC